MVETGRPVDGVTARVCGRFLELPRALVLAGMWLTGAALLALCGLTLYLSGTALASFFEGVWWFPPRSFLLSP